MGLAPYGEPRYVDGIREHLVDLRRRRLVPARTCGYFDYLRRPDDDQPPLRTSCSTARRGQPESPLDPARDATSPRRSRWSPRRSCCAWRATRRDVTGEPNLCLAGGVALNCVANGRMLREGPFDGSGSSRRPATPAARSAPRCRVAPGAWASPARRPTACATPCAAPSWARRSRTTEIAALPRRRRARRYERVGDRAHVADRVAELLADGQGGGLVPGPHGVRAPGAGRPLDPRAIPARRSMQSPHEPQDQVPRVVPAVRPVGAGASAPREWFELDDGVALHAARGPGAARAHLRRPDEVPGADDLRTASRQVRSDIPAVTHVDYSARVQTVTADQPRASTRSSRPSSDSPVARCWSTPRSTSGASRSCCTPDDAYRCFMRTEMDHLVLEDCLLERSAQPAWTGAPLELELD